jgi:anaerobic ribonucleoside-triphosphate reductase
MSYENKENNYPTNEKHLKEREFKDLKNKVKILESIVMQIMKDKSTKDLSEIFNMTEKEVRDTKAIVSGM